MVLAVVGKKGSKGISKKRKEGNTMTTRGNTKNWVMLGSLVFAIVVVGMVVGIRTGSTAPVTSKPVQLRMMVSYEPMASRLTPARGFGSESVIPIVYNVMEPLIDVGKKGEPVPKLATKWEQSADLKRWRFYLRKGVKFHNGADFTARDVVEYVKWNFEEKDLSELYSAVPAKEAIAVDDYTVDLIFEKPQPLLLISGRSFLIPPTAVSRDNRKMAETQPIGTGPYRFGEWNRGMNVKLTRFENYWGPKPQIDEVAITFREESAVRLAALIAGETDWVSGLGPEQAVKCPKVIHAPSPETVWIRYDEYIQKEWTGADPIFADKRLRQAVDYALDRKALMALYEGMATLSLGQFASPGEFGFNPALKSRSYDLEKAKALVKEAGAVGKTITFVCASDRWPKSRAVGEALAYMIEKTGLKVKLMLMPDVEVSKYKSTRGEDRKLKSDILVTVSDAALQVEDRFPGMFVKGGKHCAVDDPESARLFREFDAEADINKRREKLGKAWAYAYDQAHYIPMFKLENIWGVAKNLEWNLDIAGRPFFTDMRLLAR